MDKINGDELYLAFVPTNIFQMTVKIRVASDWTTKFSSALQSRPVTHSTDVYTKAPASHVKFLPGIQDSLDYYAVSC